MKRERFFLFLIVVLILLNVGTLGWIGYHEMRPTHPAHDGRPDKMLIETLHWDAQQIDQFNTLKHAHHERMMELDERMTMLGRAYFDMIAQPQQDTTIRDSILHTLGAVTAEKAQVTYAHIESLKAICTPAQREKFDALIPKMIGIFIAPNRGHAGPPPDNMPPHD